MCGCCHCMACCTADPADAIGMPGAPAAGGHCGPATCAGCCPLPCAGCWTAVGLNPLGCIASHQSRRHSAGCTAGGQSRALRLRCHDKKKFDDADADAETQRPSMTLCSDTHPAGEKNPCGHELQWQAVHIAVAVPALTAPLPERVHCTLGRRKLRWRHDRVSRWAGDSLQSYLAHHDGRPLWLQHYDRAVKRPCSLASALLASLCCVLRLKTGCCSGDCKLNDETADPLQYLGVQPTKFMMYRTRS